MTIALALAGDPQVWVIAGLPLQRAVTGFALVAVTGGALGLAAGYSPATLLAHRPDHTGDNLLGGTDVTVRTVILIPALPVVFLGAACSIDLEVARCGIVPRTETERARIAEVTAPQENFPDGRATGPDTGPPGSRTTIRPPYISAGTNNDMLLHDMDEGRWSGTCRTVSRAVRAVDRGLPNRTVQDANRTVEIGHRAA